MTPVRLFRDTDVPETQGECTSPEVQTELSKLWDAGYNTGVDNCIKMVDFYNTGKELSPLVNAIIEKLKSLKK